MEHQRGAFKVKPADSADAVKESPKCMGHGAIASPLKRQKTVPEF